MIDTHFHLPNNISDFDSILKDAMDNGVNYFILGGSDIINNKNNILCRKDNVFITLGYHPEFADAIGDDDLELLENQIKEYKPVAVGEIGLDYHYCKDNKNSQIALFEKQLKLAVKYNLPVVIHTRDATLDTINILKKYNLKGVIHCFSGSLEVALEYIKMGYFLGIGGVVTFKNSHLKDVIKEMGLKNVVLETDSPYLSPNRGEVNYPKNIRIINDYLAELLNISPLEVEKITTSNARLLFDLNIKN